MQKIGCLLNDPTTSWAYSGYDEPSEITTWAGSPFAQVFCTRVHDGEFQRIYITFDFSPISDEIITLQSNEKDILTLSDQNKKELLGKCKVINMYWFITTLSGAEGRVGIVDLTEEGLLKDVLEFRVINEFDNFGSVGTEYGGWTAGLWGSSCSPTCRGRKIF